MWLPARAKERGNIIGYQNGRESSPSKYFLNLAYPGGCRADDFFSFDIASFSHNNKNAMAEGVPLLSMRMRDNLFLGDNGADNVETASQESREDIIDKDPGFIEDRFRVDRKKLEQMLQLGEFCYP